MIKTVINELKKYTAGKKNTDTANISVLALDRFIFALEKQEPILDEIRAEIASQLLNFEPDTYNGIVNRGIYIALEIIDKHKKTESEE